MTATPAATLNGSFSEDALRYLLLHAIEPDVAREAGVREERGALVWPYRRARLAL